MLCGAGAKAGGGTSGPVVTGGTLAATKEVIGAMLTGVLMAAVASEAVVAVGAVL